jgi:hypothetical protein
LFNDRLIVIEILQLGHPGVAAASRLPRMPYGGVDTRVFIYKPHIALPRFPLKYSGPSLFIESDKGAFYRYCKDNRGNIQTHINVSEAAAVILRHYKAPKEARGNRGNILY